MNMYSHVCYMYTCGYVHEHIYICSIWSLQQFRCSTFDMCLGSLLYAYCHTYSYIHLYIYHNIICVNRVAISYVYISIYMYLYIYSSIYIYTYINTCNYIIIVFARCVNQVAIALHNIPEGLAIACPLIMSKRYAPLIYKK